MSEEEVITKKYIEAQFNIKLYFTVNFDPDKIHSWNIDGSILTYKLTEESEEQIVQAQIKLDDDNDDKENENDKPTDVKISDTPFFLEQGNDDNNEDAEDAEDAENSDNEEEDDEDDEDDEDEETLVSYQIVMYLLPYYEGKVPKVHPKYKDVVTGVLDINKYSEYISSNGIIEITRPFYKLLEQNEESALLVSFCRWAVRTELPYNIILNTEELDDEDSDSDSENDEGDEGDEGYEAGNEEKLDDIKEVEESEDTD